MVLSVHGTGYGVRSPEIASLVHVELGGLDLFAVQGDEASAFEVGGHLVVQTRQVGTRCLWMSESMVERPRL